MKAVTFLSVKGGVGKTILSVNTADMMAETAKGNDKVLIIDLDAQASATLYLLGHKRQRDLERRGQTAYDALRAILHGSAEEFDKYVVKPSAEWSEGLYLVPGSYRILGVERVAPVESGLWLLALRTLVSELGSLGYQYVFVDPPATLGVLSRMALGACNYFVTPIIPDEFGRGSFRMFVSEFFNSTVYELKNAGLPLPLCGGIVFNRLKTKTHERIADEIEEEVKKRKLYGRYMIPVFSTRLHDYVAYTKAIEEHVPLHKLKGGKYAKKASKEFEEFFNEFYEYVVNDKAKKLKRRR